MNDFARLIIKIDIAAKKAASVSTVPDFNKNPSTHPSAALRGKKKAPPLSLKIKLLHILLNGVSLPCDIMAELCLKSSNLAALTRELTEQKLIAKRRLPHDKRVIAFSITQKGADYLEQSLAGTEAAARQAFGSGYADATAKLSDAVNILEFL